MGKITRVSSSIYNLIGDKEPVRNIRVITMQYLFNDYDRFTPVLIDSLLEGNGIRFRNYLKWAERSGYNDWLGISAPSFMQTIRIDPSKFKETFKSIMESNPNLDIEERFEYKDTDITIRYPNPAYVLDPITGEYPPDEPEYLTKDIIYAWEYYSRAEITLHRWNLSNYRVDAFAPIILDMCFARSLKDLRLTAEDVIDGDTNYSTGQIEKNGRFYLRFGDLTTYNTTETEPGIASDLSDESTWDNIIGDVDITSLVQKPISTYFIGVLFYITRNKKKAIYESYEDTSGKIIYISTTEEGSLNRIGWEEAVASSPEDPYEDWVGVSDKIWSDVQNMGPLYTLQSESIDTFKVAYIWSLPTGYSAVDNLIPTPTIIDDDYWGSWFPLRDDNRGVHEDNYPVAWEWGKKVGKKLFDDTGKIAEIQGQVESNKQIGDIDYCYLEIGIPLNVKQKYVCRYMFEFWRNMFDRVGAQTEGEVMLDIEYPTDIGGNGTGRTYIFANLPESAVDATTPNYNDVPSTNIYDTEDRAIWHSLYGQERISEGTGIKYHIRNGIVLPIDASQAYKVTSGGTINIAVSGAFNRHISISFGGILYQEGNGILDTNHDSGDCWANLTQDTFVTLSLGQTYSGVGSSTPSWGHWAGTYVATVNWISYYRQIDATHWEVIRVAYINQANIIKNGVGDYNYGVQEFNKAEEDGEYSGVLIPLSYNTISAISLLDATDCMQFASTLRFNCYVVKKKKWYQSGFFGALISFVGIVVTIVISYIYPPAAPAVGGIAGALGVTSVIAGTIINVVVNAVIAAVVVALVEPVLSDILGDFWGTIISTVASMLVVSGVNGMINSGKFSLSSFGDSAWKAFSDPMNFLSLGKSVGNAYIESIQNQALKYQKETAKIMEDYQNQSQNIANLTEQNLSGFGSNIWTNVLVRSALNNCVVENIDTFLTRTLMVGSDVASYMFSYIEDYPEFTIAEDPSGNLFS